MAWWRRTDEASTSAVGLIIAAATFGIAFSAANLMVEKPSGVDHIGGRLDHTAATALDVIVSQPGRATNGGAWTVDADLLDRFGLAKSGEENFLDYVKIKSMRNASYHHTENNAPDYTDVRAALGIDDRDFHLRTYPVIPGIDDPRWSKNPHGRLAYFAHYGGPVRTATLTHTITTVVDTSPTLNVSLTIKNDASVPTIFVANVGLGDGTTASVTEQRRTRLIPAGETDMVWVEFPRLKDWNNAFTRVKIDVADPYGNTVVAPAWYAAVPPENSAISADWGVKVQASQLYYETGQKVAFTGENYDGNGLEPNDNKVGHFSLVGPTGTVIFNDTVTLPKGKNKVFTYTCEPAVCGTVGVYTATLWDASPITTSTNKAQDKVYVAADKMFNEKVALDPLAEKEVALIKELVVNFNAIRFEDTAAPAGDIFGDDSNGPHELSSQLSRYTMLIIGSEVSQTALNSAATKYGIADWVQKGGNLIVLGTQSQQSNWLEPVYHAAQINANGGIGTPDPTHPVLSSPNRLDYMNYLDRGRAWDIENDAPFTHIISRGPGGTSMIDTLAVAAPGAYNEGTVVLTSYMPGALTAPQDDREALRFLHNLMSQSYNMLFLDYGPPIPDKTPVGSAQRLVAVPHPNVPGAVVEVRIVMYAWT